MDHVESLSGDAVEVGTDIHVSALVKLGSLTPDDIEVQLVTGLVDSEDNLNEPRVPPFPTGVDVEGGLRRYEGTVEGRSDTPSGWCRTTPSWRGSPRWDWPRCRPICPRRRRCNVTIGSGRNVVHRSRRRTVGDSGRR